MPSPLGDFIDHRDVRVREHDECDIAAFGEQIMGVGRLPVRGALELCMRPILPGEPGRQAAHQSQPGVGVQQAERADGEWMAHDGVKHSRTKPCFAQPVAMRHERAVSREVDLGRPRVEPRTELCFPKPTTPAVVVAAHDRERRTAAAQGGQTLQGWKAGRRYRRSVLEPELEQVTVDQEMTAQGRHRFQETVKPIGHVAGGVPEMGISDDDGMRWRHGRSIGQALMAQQLARAPAPTCARAVPPTSIKAMTNGISTIELRVRYAETDQMGVAHHASYLVWCEQARTDHMRALGVRYRALEERGIRLPVVEASLRYRQPARYDDRVAVRCWVRDVSSRRVTFGYAVERDDTLLATAVTSLIAVDGSHTLTRIPDDVRAKLIAVADPVRL